MTSFIIRAYERPQPKPLVTVHAAQERAMTAQEAWLNTLAQTEAFSGLVTIWHADADGALSSFTAMLPDVARMAFVGIAEGE